MSALNQDPPREAVAIQYDAQSGAAPRVVASGRGDVARHMTALADEHGVPLVEDPDLVALLSVCGLGEEIPEELFDVVAHLLAFLYRMNGELRGTAEPSADSAAA